MKNKVKTKTFIRGIPPEVYRNTKAMAAKQGKTIGQYVSEALIQFNALDGIEKKSC